MKKVLIGTVLVIAACGGADSLREAMDPVPGVDAQDGTGGGNGTGNGPVEFVEVECDQSAVKIEEHYDQDCQRDVDDRCVRDEFNNTIQVRTELDYTRTTTTFFAVVDVADPAGVITKTCDYINRYDPPLDTGTSVTNELVRDDGLPERECYINHGGGFTADGRLIVQCETVIEQVYNKANTAYNPVRDVDRVHEYGQTRHYVGEL